MNIDVRDAAAVQKAVDKVVQGTGLRFTSVTSGTTQPMARVEVKEVDGKTALHVLPMAIDGKDLQVTSLEEMETTGADGEGLRFVAGGREYTVYPLGDVSPALIEAGRSYEQRVAAAKQDELATYQRYASQAGNGVGA